MFSQNKQSLNCAPNNHFGELSSNLTPIRPQRSDFIAGASIGALFLGFLSFMLFALYLVGSTGSISTTENNQSLYVPSHLQNLFTN